MPDVLKRTSRRSCGRSVFSNAQTRDKDWPHAEYVERAYSWKPCSTIERAASRSDLRDDFPAVSREQAIAAFEQAKEALIAPEMGWASTKNGELLALAVAQFGVFLTVDRNLSYQQDLSAFDIAVVVMVPPGNRLN